MSKRALRGETTQVVLLENGSPIANADPTSFTKTSGIAVRERRTLGRTEFDLEADFGGHTIPLTIPMVTPELMDALQRYEEAVQTHAARNFTLGVTMRFPETGQTRSFTFVDLEFPGSSLAIANATDGAMTLQAQTGKPAVWVAS